MKINFVYMVKFVLSKEQKNKFKEVIQEISIKENKKISLLNLIFCSDDIIIEYNKEYLSHEYATDIITFHDVNENGETEGELLMSVDTIKENAVRYKTEPDEELKRVIIHGVLHLCGFKDKTKKQKDLMRLKENQYLKIN